MKDQHQRPTHHGADNVEGHRRIARQDKALSDLRPKDPCRSLRALLTPQHVPGFWARVLVGPHNWARRKHGLHELRRVLSTGHHRQWAYRGDAIST